MWGQVTEKYGLLVTRTRELSPAERNAARSRPGLAAAIGGYDADIEVVGSPELREAFAHLARRYADAAGQGRDAGEGQSRTSGTGSVPLRWSAVLEPAAGPRAQSDSFIESA